MLWSPKCSCQFLWRQIVIVMFTASQIKSSTHVSSSPKSKSMPSLLHTHTHTRHNNLYGCLDLLAIQELLGPPPFHAPLQSPTSGAGQSLKVPRERFLVAPQKKKRPSLSLPGVQEGIKNDRLPLPWGDAKILRSLPYCLLASVHHIHSTYLLLD